MTATYQPMSDDSVFTVEQFAREFGLSENAVRYGVDAGLIPGERTGDCYRCFIAATRSFTEDDAAGLPEEAV